MRRTTQAPLPAQIAGQFGPQLTALIAYLTVVCRLPRLVVQRLLEGALQIPISLGSTQKAWEEASAALGAPYEELQAALPAQPVLNADETGHRTNAAKRWLWTVVAPTFVFYTIATSRGSDVLRRLLGATFAGILGSDRLRTYTTYAASQRQFCWSHVTRNLLSAQELAKTAAGKRFCREALALQRRLFRLWHRFRGDPRVRGGPLTREPLIANALPLEKAFFALAEQSVNVADIDASNLARALLAHHPDFFTFVHEAGVEPTNNAANAAGGICRRMPRAGLCRLGVNRPPVARGGSLVRVRRRVGIIRDLPRRPARGLTAGTGQGEAHAPWCEPWRAL